MDQSEGRRANSWPRSVEGVAWLRLNVIVSSSRLEGLAFSSSILGHQDESEAKLQMQDASGK